MTEKRFILVKCYNEQWGVVDNSLEETDQLVLITTSKSGTSYLVNELNALNNENEELKQQLKKYKQPNCRKCIEYSQDGVADYCMSEKGLLGNAWKMFPFGWDYTNAKDCKEYEE